MLLLSTFYDCNFHINTILIIFFVFTNSKHLIKLFVLAVVCYRLIVNINSYSINYEKWFEGPTHSLWRYETHK